MVNKHLQFALIIGASLISSSVFSFWPFTSSEKTEEESATFKIEHEGHAYKVTKVGAEKLKSIVVGGALAPEAACKVYERVLSATDEKGNKKVVTIIKMVVGKTAQYLIEVKNGKLVMQIDGEKAESVYKSAIELQQEEEKRVRAEALKNAAVGARGSKLMEAKAEESN